MSPIQHARRAGGIGVVLAVLVALSGIPLTPANASPAVTSPASANDSPALGDSSPADDSVASTPSAPASTPSKTADAEPKKSSTSAPGAVSPAEGQARAANANLSCAAGVVYSVSGSGQLRKLTNGGVDDIGDPATKVDSFNGLGIGENGQPVIAYERSNSSRTATFYSFDGSTWTKTGVTYDTSKSSNGDFGGSLVAGGVDLSTGQYYFGGFETTEVWHGSWWNGYYTYDTVFKLWRYASGSVTYMGYVDISSDDSALSTNGDLAFDAQGNLFIVRGSGSTTTIFSVTKANLGSADGGPITSSKSADKETMNDVNGVAFDSAGKGYLGASSEIRSYDMPAWSNEADFVKNGLSGSTDLASCSSPATISLKKNVTGRAHSGDQFTLELKQGGTSLGTATTTGSSTGVQKEQVGPLPVTHGATISFSETAAGTTNLSDYGTTYTCTVDGHDMSPKVEGTAASGTVTIPAIGQGQAVECEFTNTAMAAAVTVDKKWSIDGTVYDNGKQPDGISASLSLPEATVPGGGAAQWGTSYSGYMIGQSAHIGETTTIDAKKFPGCHLESSSIAGTGISESTDLTPDFATTLTKKSNAYTVTNTVECQTLTIVKTVKNTHGGTLTATDWNQHLFASPTSGAKLPFDSSQKRYVSDGTYTISEDDTDGYTQEAIACTGASFDEATAKVTIGKGENATCTITNNDKAGSVTWHKTDESGSALGGSEWTLTGPDGSAVTVTDCAEASAADCTGADTDPAAGEFSVTGLDWGDYTLAESKAPAGYVLDESEHEFSLTRTSLDHEFTTAFENKQATAVTLPLTGGTGTLGFIAGGAALTLLGAAGAIILSRRRARGSN